MYILDVWWPMLNDLSWRNASERQVNGIRQWREYVQRAVSGAPHDAPSTGMQVEFIGSATHRTWRTTCSGIITALSAQARAAQTREAEATREAASRDRAAEQATTAAFTARREAATARDTALLARTQAARFRAGAAACDDEGQKAALLADADTAAAAAAAAEANAAAAEAANVEHAEAARHHRAKAAEARKTARDARAWDISARDAVTFGQRVLADEEPIARLVGEGIAASGGLAEVPASKRYAAA